MEQILPGGQVITLIHFVSEIMAPPVGTEGAPVLQWRIACMPNMTEFGTTPYHKNHMRSDDVRAVTCTACKKSIAFKKAQDTLEAAIQRRLKGG